MIFLRASFAEDIDETSSAVMVCARDSFASLFGDARRKVFSSVNRGYCKDHWRPIRRLQERGIFVGMGGAADSARPFAGVRAHPSGYHATGTFTMPSTQCSSRQAWAGGDGACHSGTARGLPSLSWGLLAGDAGPPVPRGPRHDLAGARFRVGSAPRRGARRAP